jgi:hypothetical protein
MKNKQTLLVMLAITLAFGLALIGCGEDNPLNQDDNPFKGDWSGTFTPKVNGEEGDEIEAIITFTDTRWTLTAGEAGPNQIKLSGTYSDSIVPSIGSSKTVDLNNSDGIPIATATYASLLNVKTVTVNFTIFGTYSGSSGSFKSGSNIQDDSFVGKWTGEYDDDTSATITFTDTTWTLKHGATTQNGQYSKSSIGYTATLTISEITFGTATLNPITGTLTITVGLNKGSFTRTP